MFSNFGIYYRNGFGFFKSFRFAFGRTFKDFALDIVFWTSVFALIGFVAYLGADRYAEGQAYANKNHAAYTKALEKVVADCLSDSTGKPVIIGDELYLCGIVRTGVKL